MDPGHSLKDPASFNIPGSILRNPLISAVFYDIDWAETKGTGLRTAIAQLKEEGFIVPEFFNDRINDRFILKLAQPFWNLQGIPHATDQVTDHERKKYLQNVMETVDRRVMVIEFCSKPKAAKEIMEFLKLKHKHTFRENILWPLLKSNLLKMTIPDKPNSRLQKYVAVK